MKVADIGCGLGYFTLPMAKKVGQTGKVIAVDLQMQMLKGLATKAKKQGQLDKIEPMCCSEHSLNISNWKNQLDFVLVFAVAHEVPDRHRFFREIACVAKKGAKVLLAEPRGHVSQEYFNESIKIAVKCGLKVIGEPQINRSRAVLLGKI